MNPSPWNWNTGQPSIFAPLQHHATIARKASAFLSKKLGTEPKVAPKSTRKPERPKVRRTGKTQRLDQRIDFDEVREYRLSGKSWDLCAEKFGCTKRSLIGKMVALFPELRASISPDKRKRIRGRKVIALPLEQIISEIMAGQSLRASAAKYGASSPTISRRLRTTPEGMAALAAAHANAEAQNMAKAQAKKQRDAERAMSANRLSTGSKAANNSLSVAASGE